MSILNCCLWSTAHMFWLAMIFHNWYFVSIISIPVWSLFSLPGHQCNELTRKIKVTRFYATHWIWDDLAGRNIWEPGRHHQRQCTSTPYHPGPGHQEQGLCDGKKAVIILPPYLYLAEGMKIMMLLFVKVGMRGLYIWIGIRTTGATEMGDIVV